VQLWLDNIKSHGYVVFDNEGDATAVRDAMNGVSWPPNEKRRNLSVDYIPVDKVQEWIDNEESSRGQRFEIVYVKQDGKVIVEQRITESKESHPLRLMDDSAASVKSPERGIPTGPRAARREEIPKDRFEVRGGEKVRVVGPDELFKKTTSKPWIYWAEVSTEVRERRAKK
jgi:hypothetical protein